MKILLPSFTPNLLPTRNLLLISTFTCQRVEAVAWSWTNPGTSDSSAPDRKEVSRAKTIAFFALIGPAAAAVPCLITILTLAAFHRDAQGIGIAVAALFMAYVYGLIPSAVSGLLFSWVVGRHPPVVNRAASVARVGAVAGFLSALPLAVWAFLVTERVLVYDHALIAVAFLVPGIFSGAVCAILWREWASAVTKHAPTRRTINSTPTS